MNWKSFLIGVSVGIVGGYTAKQIISQKTKVSPEKVLEHVKAQFKQNGPINGSWIHMKVEPYEQHQVQYQVYKGGISKNNDGKNEQYEFIADALTGTILDIRKLSENLVS